MCQVFSLKNRLGEVVGFVNWTSPPYYFIVEEKKVAS